MLGFEIHLKYSDESTQALYHFFITDDTLQDTEAVICAKHFLYTKVLPQYNATKNPISSLMGLDVFHQRMPKQVWYFLVISPEEEMVRMKYHTKYQLQGVVRLA